MKLLLPALLLGAFLCLAASKLAIEKRRETFVSLKGPDLQPVQVSYRADSVKKLAFGFESFLSSLLWVRLLQEATTTPLASQQVSWEFSEVDAVTTLDPNFDIAYRFGSMYVSFFRRDHEGGKRILEKWVKKRPLYWKAHHMLGMHYFLELKDTAAAAPHILRASQLPGAPQYISSLGVGLLGQAGATQFALQSAVELFESAPSAEAKTRLAKRIRSLRWHLQKEAWEKALALYRKENPGKKPTALPNIAPYFSSLHTRGISSLEIGFKPSPELTTLLNEQFAFRLNPKGSGIESTSPHESQELEHIGVYLQKESP